MVYRKTVNVVSICPWDDNLYYLHALEVTKIRVSDESRSAAKYLHGENANAVLKSIGIGYIQNVITEHLHVVTVADILERHASRDTAVSDRNCKILPWVG